jgi:hypothetical protein
MAALSGEVEWEEPGSHAGGGTGRVGNTANYADPSVDERTWKLACRAADKIGLARVSVARLPSPRK